MARNTRSSVKDSAKSTRVRNCTVAGTYVETEVAQANELMFGLTAVLSLSLCKVLERSTELDKEYRLHGVVKITAQTPTIEPMPAGTQPMRKTVT